MSTLNNDVGIFLQNAAFNAARILCTYQTEHQIDLYLTLALFVSHIFRQWPDQLLHQIFFSTYLQVQTYILLKYLNQLWFISGHFFFQYMKWTRGTSVTYRF